MKKKFVLGRVLIAIIIITCHSLAAQAGFFSSDATKPLTATTALPNATTTVKIGLAIEKSSLELSADAPFYLLDSSGKKILAKFSANEKVTLVSSDSMLVCNGKKYSPSLLVSTKADDSTTALVFDKHKFRGDFIVDCSGKDNKSLNLINIVSLEKYLYSVIGSEISTAWPLEAVKAQAIAARSFAVFNLTAKKKYPSFDMLSDTSDQVYLGKVVEDSKGRKAVDDTRGIIVVAAGKVAQTLFMASSGGRTASSYEVWGNNCSYLQSVVDYDEQSPYFRWEKQIALVDFDTALLKNGIKCGAVEEVLLSPLNDASRDNYSGDRSTSGRVKLLAIIGHDNTVELSGSEMRRMFDLRSTLFEIKISAGKIIFNGRGWGHGIGMSQWGAKQMAEAKKDGGMAAKYPEILQHYYSGSSLKRLY